MSDKMGLVGYNSAGTGEQSYVKPYSEETNENIDVEVRRIV
jgi:ATP-dependent Zn protease